MKASLSMAFEDLRGKAGTVVVSKSRSGLVVKPRVKGRNPQTPAQQAIRANLTKASAAYKGLTSAQVALWQAYAQSQTKHNPVTGDAYSPTAISAFVALASKFLQAGGTAIPATPPTTPFSGDTVTITATTGTGKVTFTASKGNAAGVQTELLLQTLKSKNRTPQPHEYRTKAFVAFATGSLTYDVIVPAGYYAAGYRFVNTATGQTSPRVLLTVVQVTMSLAEGGKSESKKAA